MQVVSEETYLKYVFVNGNKEGHSLGQWSMNSLGYTF